MGKTIAYNTGSKDDKKDDELRINFGVFIDGTLNNKTNTQLRRYSRGESEHSTISDKKKEADIKREKSDLKKIKKGKHVDVPDGFQNVQQYRNYLEGVHRSYFDKMGTDNSYSNDDTNVARMWKCCMEDYAIYVEGMGTDDNKQDSQDGFAFGSGKTGIRARVRLACERVAERVQKELIKDENKGKKLTEITFDVFGFSRGAASARNFVHEINTKRAYTKKSIRIPDGYEPIDPYSRSEAPPRPKYRSAQGDFDGLEVDPKGLLKNGQLPKLGHLGYSLLLSTDFEEEDLEELKIVVRFIGIYDTVSSYYERGALGSYDAYGNLEDDGKITKLVTFSSNKDFADDEQELGLHDLELNKMGDVTKFQKLVHFTAQDEHRKNFVLTRIKQVPNKAIEKNLPGVHCDIGGAYENEEFEVVDEIGTTAKDDKYKSKVFRWSKPRPFPYSLLDLVEKGPPEEGLEGLRQDLIDQYWYLDKELEIHPDWGYDRLTGTRKVRKEYSYVSLHFMEEYCEQTTMPEKMNTTVLSKYPLGNTFLEGIKTNLHDYVFGDDTEWKFLSDGQIAKNKYDRELEYEKQLEEEAKEREFQAQMKQFDEDLKSGKYERDQMIMKSDNLRPEIYRPKVMEINKDVPTMEDLDKPYNDDKPYLLETIEVRGYNMQKALRKLRHEYLHWSSTRDWFGMEPPNDKRERESYPKV